jgi:tetratricopeptide (TPR) repeat protein
MPIFGGSKRPKLDGLTRDEQRRLDALYAGAAFEGEASAAAVLLEKAEEEPREVLWPLSLGSHLMAAGRYVRALEAFEDAVGRDRMEVRAHYGAAMACFRAAEHRLEHGEAPSDDAAPAGMTVDNLLHASLRHFQEAMELTPDKNERDELASAAAIVRRAIMHKAGRL